MTTRWLGVVVLLVTVGCATARPTRYFEAAVEAGEWLRHGGWETEAGRTWPAIPEDPKGTPTDLYHGSAGVVLFFLELHRATDDPSYLEEACAGADHLIAELPETLTVPGQASLYTGVAGIAFVLEQVHFATGDPAYRAGALRCLRLLVKSIRTEGSGVEWDEVTDVIRGTAGIGLGLLSLADSAGRREARELAGLAGKRLLELGEPAEGGTMWRMDPEYSRIMPNFSHGTAGVAYFLAELYAATGDRSFLDGALSGASHLLAITDERGLIHHHVPDGEDLFYLGWCHGPAGTARLYLRLWELTDDESWRDAALLSANGVLTSGIPEARPEGLWNTVGQCCGTAGVAELFLGLYEETGRDEYLDFALTLTDDLLARATVEEGRRKWIQAEHRVQPELLAAQTGYMQGAAGIGLWLLRLDAHLRDRHLGLRMPDKRF